MSKPKITIEITSCGSAYVCEEFDADDQRHKDLMSAIHSGSCDGDCLHILETYNVEIRTVAEFDGSPLYHKYLRLAKNAKSAAKRRKFASRAKKHAPTGRKYYGREYHFRNMVATHSQKRQYCQYVWFESSTDWNEGNNTDLYIVFDAAENYNNDQYEQQAA